MRFARGLAVAAAIGVATGCGNGGQSDGAGSDVAAQTTVTADPVSRGLSITRALSEIPASVVTDPSWILVTAGDLDAASAANGIERPTSPADAGALRSWVLGLMHRGPEQSEFPPIDVYPAFLLNTDNLGSVAEIRARAGWSLLDVGHYVEVIGGPDSTLTLFHGDFEQNSLEAADDVIDLGNGILAAGEGEDLASDPRIKYPWSGSASPLRMALKDGVLAASFLTAPVQEWLVGSSRTLAERTDIAGVAAAMDDAAALSTMITAREFGAAVPPGSSAADVAAVTEYHIAGRFTAAGVGWSVGDQGESLVTAAYYFPDSSPEDAIGSIELAYRHGTTWGSGRPLSEHVSVESVRVDGRLAIVSLSLVDRADTKMVQDMFFGSDAFAHKP